jgi:hypothetical protein
MITMSPAGRREIAPIMQVMPAGAPITPSFFTKLGHSHGLLPIRIEHPVTAEGESWHRRLVVYDNATRYMAGSESFLTLSYDRDGDPYYTFDHEDLATGDVTADAQGRTSANRWTLSHVTLQQCLLSRVSLPTDFLVLIDAVTAVVTNAQGQRFGVGPGGAWDDLPGAYAAPGLPGVYVLPNEDDLTVTLHGTGTGTYRVMLVSGSTGTSASLLDVPVTPATVDRLQLRPSDGEVRISTDGPGKAVTVAYGRSDEDWSRALTVSSVPVGPDSPVTLRADGALGEFSLEGSRSWETEIELAGSQAGEDVRHEYGARPVEAGVTTFTVADWTRLNPDSLSAKRPGPTTG